MRTYDTPYIADWYAVSLRWLALLGMTVSLSQGRTLFGIASWPLAALVLWNLLISVLASLNVRVAWHRYISVMVDLLLTGALFWLQGGLSGPVLWAGLLPILSASIYFEFAGALVMGVIFSTLEIVALWRGEVDLVFIRLAAFGALATLIVALIFGYLSYLLVRHLRRMRAHRLDEKERRMREEERRMREEERRMRMERERWRTLYELISNLTSTLSYQRVLDSALDLGYTLLNPDSEVKQDEKLVSAVLLFKDGELTIGSARRFTNADLRVRLHGNEGILKHVFDEGEPVLTNNVSFDPELGRIIGLRNCTAAYCFPLRSGFNVYGAMLFAHPDPQYFTQERCNLLDMIGRQSVIAIQNASLYQDLLEEKERMTEVYEEARKKLARDLHDGPTQSVAAMAMRINLARRMFSKDPHAAINELVKIEELAHRTTKEIRHMLFTLRPLILESQGLTAALQAMAEKMKETFDQNVIIEVNEQVVADMEMGKQGVVFYIIEEAVNNARKHASAPNIWVRLRQLEPGLVLLEIQDDGIGFDVQAVTQSYDKRSSLGMVNLRERTELVNGLLNIQSQPGKGTIIQVYIPLTEDAADRLHHAKV